MAAPPILASIATTNTPVRSPEVFDFANGAVTRPTSSVDLLATFDESAAVSAAALLKRAREANVLDPARLIALCVKDTTETIFHTDLQKQDAVSRRIERVIYLRQSRRLEL